jgi:LCP family protein required for cell wall assembly
MRKRAIWLLALSVLLPGSAQLLAGNRRFGQFILRLFLSGVGALVLVFLIYLINRGWAITLVTAPALGFPISWVITGFGIAYLLVQLDAMRLSQLGRLYPKAKWTLLVLFLLFGIGGSSLNLNVASTIRTGDDLIASVFKRSGFTSSIDGRYNILLLGSDAGPDRTGIRTDSIKVISISESTGATAVISIPRNLKYAPFPEDSPLHEVYPDGFHSWADESLINAIYVVATRDYADLYPNAKAEGSYVGVEAVRDAVEGVTGLKMQSYVMISMDGFADLIDSVGGVDLKLQARLPIGGKEDDLSDVKGWLECKNEYPCKVHYNGYNALWYARARHGYTDYDRMRRQTEVIDATIAQSSPTNILFNFEKVAGATKKLVYTDIPSGAIGTYLDLALKLKSKKHAITSLDLVPANGFEPDMPNYKKIREAVADALKASK